MKYSVLFLLSGALFLSAAEPVLEWDFERKVQQNYLESVNASGKRSWMQGIQRKNAGVNHSNGLDCNLKSYNYVQTLKMPWKAFTVELKFKLDAEINPKQGNTLIWYAVHSWGRRDFSLKITPKKELRADFCIKTENGEKILKSFTAASKPQDIKPGRYYTIRLSSVSGGQCRLYLDGVLVAARDKALSFSDLDGYSPEYYPLLIVGGEARMAKPSYQLGGVIDDLRIWDREILPDADEEQKSVSENRTSVTLPLLLSKENTTQPFHVLDVDQQAGVVFYRAAQVFHDHAARAKLKVQGKNLIVEFLCPVSKKHPVKQNGPSIWQGEVVEFFWSTDPEKGYYQFIYGVTAKKQDALAFNKSGSIIPGWSADFKVDYKETDKGYYVKMTIPCSLVSLDPSRTDKIYRANFTRTGASAGGKSSWMDVGQNYHNFDAFGIVLGGSYADYFRNKLDVLMAKTDKHKLSKELKRKLETLSDAMSGKIDDPAKFAFIEKQIKNFENDLIIHTLSGKKLIVAQPDLWKDDITPSLLTRPVEKFKVRMAQNTITFLGFTVNNMTEKRFLCRLKCMDSYPVFDFDSKPQKPFALDAGFREAVPHDDLSGKSLYDALVELPMGQLLRVPAKETAAVWLRLSSKGIAPGIYKTKLVIKSATEGIQDEVIPLEVEVLPVDLGRIQTDSALYNYIQARFVNNHSAPKEELIRYLVERDINYLYCNVPGGSDMKIYPPMDAAGNPGKCDFTDLDNNIEIYVKYGMPLERIKLWFYLAMNVDGYCMNNNGKYPRLFSKEWHNGFASFLKQLYAHLKSKYGITSDRIVLYPIDEPHGDVNDSSRKYSDPAASMYMAYRCAKLIKSIMPDARIMANPYAYSDDAVSRNNFKKLSEYVDIISPYSGLLTPSFVKYIKSLPFKEYWTYNILQKIHAPGDYCRKLWENMHNGFSTVSGYWHTDQADGGDAFCAFDVNSSFGTQRRNDYASIFADFSNGKGVVSRRQEAYYLGCQDAKLIILCRSLAKGTAEADEIEKLISKGASGDMETIAACRERLLDIAMKLSRKTH